MSGAIVVGGGKGAGSGDAVSVEPVVIPDEPSVADPGEPAAEVVAATSPTSSNPTIGWLGGGALGLAAGVGIGLTARRRSGAERARDEA
jgi:hypothetical protein